MPWTFLTGGTSGCVQVRVGVDPNDGEVVSKNFKSSSDRAGRDEVISPEDQWNLPLSQRSRGEVL